VIPRVAHFVYGLRPQTEPFHVLHYVAIESCRRMVEPEAIFVHHGELPWGAYWDLIRPSVTLVPVEPVAAVRDADYRDGHVPAAFRYAHHADFIRLDALLAHGGLYADIDTVFLRPLPDELFRAPFVIGTEGLVADERTGERRPSLCNALMLATPGAPFARAWRDRMTGALNGTWSNHSGFLAATLAEEMPDQVVVVPERRFFPVTHSVDGLHALLEADDVDDDGSSSVHLWAHLWWDRDRRDFSAVHAGQLTAERLRVAPTSLGRFVRPHLPELDVW
jgi:hypothetical protein